MRFDEFVKLIPKIKNIPLPAESSHSKMIPASRKAFVEQQEKQMKSAKQAGVLALFYPNSKNETCFILILRKTYKGVHSAQISFPGGKKEPNDKNLEETALRETFEEVGVLQDRVEVVKKLSQVYIPPSNFCVQPFIGISAITPNFVKEDAEVEALIKVKLLDLLNTDSLISKKVETSYSVDIEVPAFLLNGFTVWGATAMMLSEIKDILNKLV